MYGVVTKKGDIATSTTLEGIKALKAALIVEGEIVSQIQSKSTLEALLEQLKGE